jgi:carbonic anhydrase
MRSAFAGVAPGIQVARDTPATQPQKSPPALVVMVRRATGGVASCLCHSRHDSRQEEMRPMISQLLEGNARFVAEEYEPNAEYYQTIAAKQTPKVLWIGCSDSRVSEHQMTGSKPGTMFVHRNVANIVAFNDVNISSILEYGVVHLKNLALIKNQHAKGPLPRIHGWLYRVESGTIDVLVDGRDAAATA